MRRESSLDLIAVGDILEPEWRVPVDTTDLVFRALKSSVRASGILQPVLLRRLPDGRLQLVSGMRRVRAARDTGLDFVPATIRTLTDVQAVVGAWDAVVRDSVRADQRDGLERMLRAGGMAAVEASELVGSLPGLKAGAGAPDVPAELVPDVLRGQTPKADTLPAVAVESAEAVEQADFPLKRVERPEPLIKRVEAAKLPVERLEPAKLATTTPARSDPDPGSPPWPAAAPIQTRPPREPTTSRPVWAWSLPPSPPWKPAGSGMPATLGAETPGRVHLPWPTAASPPVSVDCDSRLLGEHQAARRGVGASSQARPAAVPVVRAPAPPAADTLAQAAASCARAGMNTESAPGSTTLPPARLGSPRLPATASTRSRERPRSDQRVLSTGGSSAETKRAAESSGRGGQRDRTVDALRGLAALMVVTLHGMYGLGPTSPPLVYVDTLTAFLSGGVALFFVLSGYLISRPFIVALVDGGPRPRIADYARRRVLRILPAYWVWFAMSASLLTVGSVDVINAPLTKIDLGGWASGLGMVAVMTPGNAILLMPQAWSMTIEAVFYCAVPILAFVALRACRGHCAHPGAVCIALLGLWAGSIWALTLFFTYPGYTVAHGATLVAGYGGLLMPGMLLALATTTGVRDRMPRVAAAMRAPVSRAAMVLVVGLSMWGAVRLFDANPASATAQIYYRECEAVAGVFAVAACLGTRALWWRIVCRVLAPIGAAAYSLYLVHWFVMREVADHGLFPGAHVSSEYGWVANVVVLTALALVLAGLSYRLIEKPAVDLGRVLERRSASRRGTAVVRSGRGAVVVPLGSAPIGVVAAIPDPPGSFS